MNYGDFLNLLARIRDEGINEARNHGLNGIAGERYRCVAQATLFRAANMVVWGFEDGRELSFEEVIKEAVKGVLRRSEALELLCRQVDALVGRALRNAGSEGHAPVFVDVGCGSGLALALVASHPSLRGGDGVHLVGVDHDPLMLEALKVMLPQAIPVRASAEFLPLRRGTADAVMSIGMVHEVGSVKLFVESVARVLRGGGGLLIADTFAPSLTAALMRVGRTIRVALSKGPENPWGLSEILRILRASGLSVSSVKKLESRMLRTYPAIITAVKEASKP